MDIFRLRNPRNATRMEQGEIINGLTDKMWVERYLESCEFKVSGNLNSNIREQLPIGSFISHTNTGEIMIVENHEVVENRGRPTTVVVTGRGYDTFFDNRIVGSNLSYPATTGQTEYTLQPSPLWSQVQTMLNFHLTAANLYDDNNTVENITIVVNPELAGGSGGVLRTVKRGPLLQRAQELLAIDNVGLKIVRPCVWSSYGRGNPTTYFHIHRGADLTASVIFSYDSGELESADYLWSNQTKKNAAFVSGKWVETWVVNTENFYDRRVMLIDASDIDQAWTTMPTGAEINNINSAMQQRGRDILASQNDIALTKVEVAKDTHHLEYRKDYAVGDVITVFGNFNEKTSMRITEYVEIEDKNGFTGYPTLALV